jgi:metallophosphoesterase superfamily enzyme
MHLCHKQRNEKTELNVAILNGQRRINSDGLTAIMFLNIGERMMTNHDRKVIKKQEEKVFIMAGDLINHPPHYNKGEIECIDAIEAMLTEEEYVGYLRGNSLKYRWRFRYKDGKQDLEKANWYENRLMDVL